MCGFQPRLARELGFGRILHHTIAELARRSASARPPTAREADEVLDAGIYLPFAGPAPAGKLREAARRRIRRYVRDHGAELTRTIRPEAGFEVPLAEARVRGRIDLLLHADGDRHRVELVDFKTSANRPPDRMHQNQLRLYAEAAVRQGHEVVGLAIHDLDGDGARIPVTFDDSDRVRFEEELGGWIEGIRSRRFEPAESAGARLSCDFGSFCPRARGRRPRNVRP